MALKKALHCDGSGVGGAVSQKKAKHKELCGYDPLSPYCPFQDNPSRLPRSCYRSWSCLKNTDEI